MNGITLFRVFILICAVFATNSVYSQTTSIKGHVSDERGQPIPYASVVISTDSLSKKDISYAVTDEHGQFTIGQLSAIPDKRWIHVRSIGYLGFHKQISLRAVKSSFDVTLTEDTKELEEVVVVARARDAYAKGDTLVFNSKNYTLGNERNLGDVVKKMPGMEVDRTGNISYQGKKIDKVLVDGQDIRQLSRQDYRRQFGMVLQDAWLYEGTIKENLRFGNLDASDEEIIEAAKAANVDHFIRTLPSGYNMEMNQESSNISLGQKQLLTIARALLANPKILILDEATSSVDTRLELLIQKAMKRLMKGRTSFVIAHRLSTIQEADKILVLKDGQIIEQGNHESLLQAKGFYYDLYQSQFSSKSEQVG